MRPSSWSGAEVIVWRRRMRVTQREAAAMVGCSRRFLQSVEAGMRPVPLMMQPAAERLLDRRERLRAWLQRADRRGDLAPRETLRGVRNLPRLQALSLASARA